MSRELQTCTLECRLMSRELQSVVFPCFTLSYVNPEIYIAVLAFDGSSLSQSHNSAVSYDNQSLQEAPLSENAHKFKVTVVLDGGSLLYSVHHQQEKGKHVRDTKPQFLSNSDNLAELC